MVKQTTRRAMCAGYCCLLTGCGAFLDLPSDPELAPTGPWRCLSTAANNAPPSAATSALTPTLASQPPRATARVSFQACDFITSCTVPVTGLHAKLCDKLDVGCNSPRIADITDQNGSLVVDVPMGPRGFDGYLQVVPSLARCDDRSVFGGAAGALLCGLTIGCDLKAPSDACYIPTHASVLWFFNPPVTADIEQPIPLQLYPYAALPLVIDAAGGTLDPTTGAAFLSALDCDGQPASGVSFRIAEYQDRVRSLYFTSGVLSNTALETDSTGSGGFTRIPPGFVELSAVNGAGVTVGEVGLVAKASFVTYSVLVPSAR